MLKSDLLGLIFPTSGAEARKCWNRRPGTYSVDFWNQGQKMLQWDILDPILTTFRANVRKCLNRTSWGFCFVDFWSPNQKMLKSDFQEPILSTSGANAKKCSLQFWPLSLLPSAFLAILPTAPTLLPVLPTIGVGHYLRCNSAHCRYQPKLSLQFRPLSLSAPILLAILPTVAVGPGSPCNPAHCRCWPQHSLRFCLLSLLGPSLLASLPIVGVGPTLLTILRIVVVGPISPCNSGHCFCWPRPSL